MSKTPVWDNAMRFEIERLGRNVQGTREWVGGDTDVAAYSLLGYAKEIEELANRMLKTTERPTAQVSQEH